MSLIPECSSPCATALVAASSSTATTASREGAIQAEFDRWKNSPTGGFAVTNDNRAVVMVCDAKFALQSRGISQVKDESRACCRNTSTEDDKIYERDLGKLQDITREVVVKEIRGIGKREEVGNKEVSSLHR